ncbi:MAG: TonB family protein [Planctomycetes bacterium]|nr:TonB family protein [Planctomycetota bacterium]
MRTLVRAWALAALLAVGVLACTSPSQDGTAAPVATSSSLVTSTAVDPGALDPAAVEPASRSQEAHEERAAQATPPAAAVAALPRFASGELPVYPRMSRRIGEEGWVEITIDVLQDGEVVGLAISGSSGSARLEAAALAAARTWRFLPRTGSRGVDRLVHRIVFRLSRS